MAKTNIHTLVLCDDTWHPASIVRRGLAPLRNFGFELEFLEDGSRWSTEMMSDFSLVVLAKANITSSSVSHPWLTQKSERELPDFVARGNGLVVVHAGTCRYDIAPATCQLMGGGFLRHPEQCLVKVSPTTDHALTDGVPPFAVCDEHYFIEMNDASAGIFLRSQSEHGEQPAGWVRSHQEGRVCVLTPGHNEEVWLHPSFQRLLLNALQWAARRI